jgi:hypothetical protein
MMASIDTHAPPGNHIMCMSIAARKGCRHISQDARGEQGDSDSSGNSSARYRCIHFPPHPCLPLTPLRSIQP